MKKIMMVVLCSSFIFGCSTKDEQQDGCKVIYYKGSELNSERGYVTESKLINNEKYYLLKSARDNGWIPEKNITFNSCKK
ncbi:hypothetical protein KP22_04175 [Pectobacterium betavasculorum]|uniref:Lipoprotein n=1 Tax=Pectobacterium betavasculorum TaxID=55207 RepID=A0A093SAW8_9GAMM|nr:hypothetical protein KP22_04175 [Pectobacterium betavasculorum]